MLGLASWEMHLSKRIFVSTLPALIALSVTSSVCGANEQKAAFDRAKATDGGVGMPTPYDKFLALDEVLSKGKVDWAKVARAYSKAIDTDEFKDTTVAVPLALGMRIADGVMTVKAKDAEQLNRCASDIEKLAKKLGVSDAEMSRGRAVRTAANKGDWLKVFMELGFFQQDIMKKLTDEKDPTKGTLIVVAGWLQGARYTAGVVEENYTPALSNILREPMLVKSLAEKVAALPASVKSTPQVAKTADALQQLGKLLDIPTEGTISKDDVHKIVSVTSDAVAEITKAAK